MTIGLIQDARQNALFLHGVMRLFVPMVTRMGKVLDDIIENEVMKNPCPKLIGRDFSISI